WLLTLLGTGQPPASTSSTTSGSCRTASRTTSSTSASSTSTRCSGPSCSAFWAACSCGAPRAGPLRACRAVSRRRWRSCPRW
ncbi:MAG: ATP synthase F0 sector subunit a, partial [uncultured Ramlibacter sp.]